MGCDFADRAGRGARRPEIRCQAIMMVTVADYERAREEDDLLGDIEVQDGVKDETGAETYQNNPKSRLFGLDVARFITAENCYVNVLDEILNNPKHISCYEAGTCQLCVAGKARDEAAGLVDARVMDRAVKREQVDQALASEEDTGPDQEDSHTEVKRKTPLANFA
ncbi:hypothetical protein FRC11_006356, partial [Ceratobasidium sp. 423]